MKRNITYALSAAMMLMLMVGCATQRKMKDLRESRSSAELTFMKDTFMPVLDSTSSSTVSDTLKVSGLDGKEVLIMKAVQDDEGNMVAHDVLDAARVTARFRNIAERNGKVNINFQVIVPREMIDSKWQLRLYPDMFVMEDSIRLDPVLITGVDYRKTQLKGYERYDRFVNSIITDTSVFVNAFLLERFLRRNFREVYAFREDSTFVTDEQWKSAFGVTGPEAVDHYKYDRRIKINERKKARMDRMFHRYVKSPIVSEGLRLDTVMRSDDGSFIYDYIQQINTRPKLRKVDIKLSGEIFEQDKQLYRVPEAGPLTFYISSLNYFVDARERYLTRVIERKASADTRCFIEFATGKDNIDYNLSRNKEEFDRIKGFLASLMEDQEFDLDSIVVTSYASPEGKASFNERLCARRATSVTEELRHWMSDYADSLEHSSGFAIDETGKVSSFRSAKHIRMTSRSHGEDWETLDMLIDKESDLIRSEYFSLHGMEIDRREYLMQSKSWYKDIKARLYPQLRSVRIDFHMHRKGMVKDTVHTTVIDEEYMAGVRALQDMDYELALEILRPYDDYNTAVAHLGMGHNASAMTILERQKPDGRVNYMKAVIHSRRGEERDAVECYIRACEQEPSYIHRGNLDPEISYLIGKYGLNLQEDEFEYDL